MHSNKWELRSPDGSLRIVIAFDEHDGVLSYSVMHDHALVIAPSLLGLTRSDADFASGLTGVSVSEIGEADDVYLVAHGKQAAVRDRANELTVSAESSGHVMSIVFRAYDEGAAFRYVFGGDGGLVTVVDEATEFSFAQAGAAWIQASQAATDFAPAYENLYEQGIAIGHATNGPSWNLGCLFRTGMRWVMLAEADVDSSYFGGHLGAAPRGTTYRVVLPQVSEGSDFGEVEPTSLLPWCMPWRVIMIGHTPAPIVESTLITSLSRPAAGPSPEWVEPGRVSWGWWSDHDSSQNLDALRDYVDLAAEMSWEHTLLDANWSIHPDDAIRDLIRYAERKGVGVFLWYNSGGPNNTVTEAPRDRMFARAERRREMAKLAEWGVKGVKVDFFHSDKQSGIALYLDILEDAADFRLMVNFHGCTIPRGWSRTYPHLMTMEGVAGAEQYTGSMESFSEAAPSHNVTLAFTRNVVGPMDYTPVTFSDSVIPHITTNAHELALSVVFESGLQHFADSAQSYRGRSEKVRAFLSKVPVVWDETRFVEGLPGEYIVLARRNGSTWYVGGINGTGEPLPVKLEFGFARGQLVTILSDGETRDEISAIELELGGELSLTMAPHGGFAVRVPA